MNTQAPSTPPPKEKSDEKERKSKYKFQADSLSKAKKATAGTPTEPSRNVPGKPLVDFFIFAKFPAEIQDEVWETVCFQDAPTISIIVEQASIKMVGPLPKFPHFLHATSGARGIGLRYYEVLTSFDIFDREYRAALNLQAVAPNAPNTWMVPPGTWVPAAGVLGHGPGAQVGLHGQMNQAAQAMGQFGPGHVLGAAGNNPNTNNGPLPNAPLMPLMGQYGPPLPVFNIAQRISGTPALPKNKVILMGAFPVLAGNVVGLCDEPGPTHPLLPVEPPRAVLPGPPGYHNFYANLFTTTFKLQIGDALQYNYPTFSLAEESSVTCAKNFIDPSHRQQEISALLRSYAVPPSFPTLGKLPYIFKKVENLVLNISLPHCDNPTEFSKWATKNSSLFLSSLYVRNTVRRFPNLRHLDFYIPGDHKINPFGKMALKHWREVAVRDTDGMTLGRSQLGLLEMIMDAEMTAIRKELDKPDFPAPRLLVYVPQKADRMEFDADFVD